MKKTLYIYLPIILGMVTGYSVCYIVELLTR